MRRPTSRTSTITGEQIRSCRRNAGINRFAAAVGIGVSERQLAAYESGSATIPLLVELALEALIARRVSASGATSTATSIVTEMATAVGPATSTEPVGEIVETTGIDVLTTTSAAADDSSDDEDLYGGGGYADDDE